MKPWTLTWKIITIGRDDLTHPGPSLRDDLEEVDWTVNEFDARLGVSRNTASRLLNGLWGISPSVPLALERIGCSTADFWMRRQAGYDLSQARRRLATVAETRS